MELLVAFLIAFGVVNAKDAGELKSESDTQALVDQGNLNKEYLIWEVEGDDF